MQNKNVIAILATLGLFLSEGALTMLHSQNAFAQISNTGSANGGIRGSGGASSGTGSYNSNGGFALVGSTGQSGAGGGSSGDTIGVGSTGQSGAGGGSSGDTIGVGSTGQSVDRHLFCNTGVITPICK